MNTWDSYQQKLEARGGSRRGIVLARERASLQRKLPSSLAFHSILADGIQKDVAIINTDVPTEKTICSVTEEPIVVGSLVVWQDRHWLITAVDPNVEVYARGTMMQCNYYLKWMMPDGTLVKRWCVVSDGTKYMAGETNGSYAGNGMSLGDTRISVALARDSYTVQLNRNYRFLIDDPDSPTVLAYRLTKPFKLGGVYDERGVMNFIFTEVNTEPEDNFELQIADYYKYFPREEGEEVTSKSQEVSSEPLVEVVAKNERKVWL